MSIHAVAKDSRVSITTVSRVFNRPDRVAISTRKRVLASAARLGFVPNASARTLRTHKSRIIGVVLPTLLNPVFAECLDGIADAAEAGGYSILPLVTEYELAREASAIERLLARNVDGLIVTVANASRPGFRVMAWTPVTGLVTHLVASGRFDGPFPFHEEGGGLID